MKKLLLTVLMSGITGMASADIVPGKTYRIASAANEERVMFVDNSSLANNTSVVVWTRSQRRESDVCGQLVARKQHVSRSMDRH